MSRYSKDFAKNAIKRAESNVQRCDFKSFTVNIKRAVEQSLASLYEDDDRDTMLNISKEADLLIKRFDEECFCGKK